MKAIVLGAGLAGLATALSLAQLGIEVLLVEKYQEFGARGSTFGLRPNGLKAVLELGIQLASLERVGIPLPTGGFMFAWWEFRDVLLNQVRSIANVNLYLGEHFTRICDSDEGAQVDFESGLKLEADFVVGADGVHSDVRTWLGLPPAISTQTTVFRGFTTLDSNEQQPESTAPLSHLLRLGILPLHTAGNKGVMFMLFSFHDKHPGRLVWVCSTDQPVSEGCTAIDVCREHVDDPEKLRVIEELLSRSDPEHLKPYPGTKIVDISESYLASLKDGGWGGRGRVTILGDAAHAMRPTDGQGGSQAFEDAVVLGRILRHTPKGRLQEGLREFERSRVDRVRRIHEDQTVRYDMRMRGTEAPPPSKEYQEWLFEGV